MKNKIKKKIILILIILIAIAIAFFGLIKVKDLINNETLENEVEVIGDKPKDEVVTQPYRDVWLKNKEINKDYQGELIFESGLVNQPFVYASSVFDDNGNMYHFYTEQGKLVTNSIGYTGNDVYIWTNWRDMTYDYNILGGSVFMDYRNTLYDQNIIIYGHHFSTTSGNDPDRVKAFTPLEKLLEEENYEENKYLDMVLDNQTRKYELACVYQFDINNGFYNDYCQYWRTKYDYDDYADKLEEGYYQRYIDSIKQVELYDTGVELTTEDNTLTLQTCIGGHAGELFEVLVFKLVDTINY